MPSNFEMESKGEIVLMVTFIYFNDSEDLGMSSGFGWSATISDVALNEPSVSTECKDYHKRWFTIQWNDHGKPPSNRRVFTCFPLFRRCLFHNEVKQ